jgi:hypothetical protein
MIGNRSQSSVSQRQILALAQESIAGFSRLFHLIPYAHCYCIYMQNQRLLFLLT